MIIAIPYILFIIYMVCLRRPAKPTAFIGGLWLFVIWMLTFASHIDRSYAQADELYYSLAQFNNLLQNRSLWLFFNYVVSLTIDGDPIIYMRLLNLLFLLILYVISLNAFRTFSPITLALFLSYFACVAALNLRDILVFVSLLWYIHRFGPSCGRFTEQLGGARRTIFPAIVLFLLRPLQLAILYVSGFRVYYGAAIIAIGIVFLQTPIASKYFYNYAWHVQNLSESIEMRGEDKEGVDPEATLKNVVVWTVRFLAAPLPWSSVVRLFDDEVYEYGIIDLSVRALHRFVFYGFGFYLLFLWVRDPVQTKQIVQRYSYLLKFCILFSVVYAIFNFGGSHERVKMNVFLCVMYLVDRIKWETVREPLVHSPLLSRERRVMKSSLSALNSKLAQRRRRTIPSFNQWMNNKAPLVQRADKRDPRSR